MKDWEIINSSAFKNRRYLKHKHEGFHSCVAIRKAEDVGWYCPSCGKIAPPEIQDVADLAHCHPDGGTQNSNYLTNSQDWYIKGPEKK